MASKLKTDSRTPFALALTGGIVSGPGREPPWGSGRFARLFATVEGGAARRHVEEDLGRREAGAVLRREGPAELDEALRAHEVDVGQRAARVGREAEAEDRADVGLARIGDHALLDRSRSF